MEEQVAVEYLIQPALGIQEADVLLQLFAALERRGELVDDLALLRGQGIGVGGVHGGEVAVLQRIRLFPDGHRLVFIVDLVQQQPVVHAKLRAAHDLLPLQLEEDDGDGLVHPGREQLVLLGILVGIRPGELNWEALTWERETGLFLRRGRLRCRAYFLARAEEGDTVFLDFRLKGAVTT